MAYLDTRNRGNILGTLVSAINLQQATDQVMQWIAQKERTYVCVTPVHSIMEAYRHSELRAIFNHSGMTTPDGMPVVWLLKFLGYSHVSRVYGPDLLISTCEASLKSGCRHYFYGGAPGIAEQLASKLQARFPGLCVAGCSSPPFRTLSPEELEQTIQIINEADPDILWIGISTPKQDFLMSKLHGKLNVPVMIGVGAAFDFHSGVKPQAPYWMQRSGLEWIFRLATEPQRLWKRYLIDNPIFVYLVLLQISGVRQFRPE